MATTLDYQKALKLRKDSGMNMSIPEAVAQVRTQALQPIAGQPPAITPIAPAPTTPIDNKQVLANNQAKVAGEIQAGTRPAVGQQSESLAPPTGTTTPSGATLNADGTVTNAPPVNATANPTTPAPTATPTTATASNTATGAVDFNVGAGREQDIVKNLQTFKTQGMDDNAIKNASGYATADATKKAQIDGFLAGQNKPLDEGTVFNSMMAGTPPPIQNTPDYRSAKYRYDQFQKFNGMSTPQLVDNLKQGEITTEMNNLLAQNPNYQLAKQQMQAYQNTQNINNAVNGFSSGINGKEIDTPDYLQALSDKILTKLGLSETSAQQAFKDIVTNDSKVVDYTNQLSAINRQVADTTKLLNDGYKDLKAQYGDMPSSALITLMNSRFSTANDTLANLNNSKSYLEADLKNAVEMARGEYEAAAQDIQNQNTIRNNLINQATQAQFGALQGQQDFANSVALRQMDYAQQQNTPSFQTIGDKVYKQQNGELTDTGISARRFGEMTDREKMDLGYAQDIGKIKFQDALERANTSNKYTKLDDGLYQDENGNILTADELKQSKLFNNTYLQKQVGQEGGECGFYASRATGMTSTPGGNSKEARTQAFSDTTPQIGGMAFFGGAGYDATYGHISIVTGVNADGTINVKDSNYNGDKTVGERTVPASSATGFYNNTPLAKSVNTQPTQGYDDSRIELLAELANMDASARNTALKAQRIPLKDVTDYMAAAKSGKIPPTEGQKQAALGVLSNIQGISELDWNDATGKYDYTRLIGTQDAENARVLIDNVRDAAALNNLSLLKGPMSDKDIAFLKSVSSKLDPVQSNSQFEKNMVEMYNIAARKVGQSEITKLSEIPKNRILPGQIKTTPTSGTGAVTDSQGIR